MQALKNNPKIGETVLSGEFKKFAGDYAISKTPKGILYALKEANEEGVKNEVQGIIELRKAR